ncbi:MAG: DUF5671 domain-containing protein [Patescibacteria group bacterium]|nr:DUF5671 domain-containing protein [Patescibacteria group bacterium]
MLGPQKKPAAFDAFVHLVTYFAMVMSAIASGGIVFQIINRFVPDLQRLAYISDAVQLGPLRFHIATLLLTGPLLLAMTGYLHRLFRQGALSTDSGVRRWLTYLLLFAAAVNVISSIIALVYQFLGGNYTVNFLLKAATVLCIASFVFLFYFWELKRADYKSRQMGATALLVVLAALFAGLLIGGFLLIGSPLQARMREYDQRRVDAAMQVRWPVEEYFRLNSKLPDTLTQLGSGVGVDPETGAAFPYEKLTDNRYQFCVTFALPSPQPASPAAAPRTVPVKPVAPGSGSGEMVWATHETGQVCHTFAVVMPTPGTKDISTVTADAGTVTAPTSTSPTKP